MTEDQMNLDICSSALEEDGTLDRSKWDGAHVWNEERDERTGARVMRCSECGAENDGTTKAMRVALLPHLMEQSERDGNADDTYYHFSDMAPESLKDTYLKHYEVRDQDYQIFSEACDVVAEVYETRKDKSRDEAEIDIYESDMEYASVWTQERLGYLNMWNEEEISEVMKQGIFTSIADACAYWYDKQVEQAAIILNDWVHGESE